MADYIEREKFRNHIREITNDPNCPLHIAAAIEQYIDDEPAADVAPVVHAEWLCAETDDEQFFLCSLCNDKEYWESNYCPNCGAKMDMEQED